MAYILGIESTCDETAASVVKDGYEICSNVVVSQIDVHKVFGGVVPELACRRHVTAVIPVVDKALREAGITAEELDAVAVAHGPGLIGALLVGLNTAKALALGWGKPFIGINHVEAHLYAAIMTNKDDVAFPALGVVVSGGHTYLVLVEDVGVYSLIGTTVDDAIGEAFDKVAKILGLPYPGGPQIEKIALEGDARYFDLKAGLVKGRPLDFSFSGLKTRVLYIAKGQSASKKAPLIIREEEKKHLAAAFQDVALKDVIDKSVLALKGNNCRSVIVGGGVSNNRRFRGLFAEQALGLPVLFPPTPLTMDNAAMIAGLGYHYFRKGEFDSLSLEAETALPFFS
jgi:N6-L-threonylcarbamoyladenine synthase